MSIHFVYIKKQWLHKQIQIQL